MWICLPRAFLSFVCPDASLSRAAAVCQRLLPAALCRDAHSPALAQTEEKPL